MISSKDRAWWFGASDTSRIMGSWKTPTFRKWWLEKLALRQNTFSTKAMKTGNAFEHKILRTIPGVEMDKQILISELHLRVNLDGNTLDTIYEVKTHKKEPFKVTTAYWQQAQVEMFAYVKKLYITAYRLTEDDYLNYFRDIEPGRLQFIPVEYNDSFIMEDYLPRLKYLGRCLEEGRMP